jgi:hypothetical protein
VLHEHFCLAVAFASALPHCRSCDAGDNRLCQQGSNADASQLVPALCKDEEPKKAFAPRVRQKQWEFARQELTRVSPEQFNSVSAFPEGLIIPHLVS